MFKKFRDYFKKPEVVAIERKEPGMFSCEETEITAAAIDVNRSKILQNFYSNNIQLNVTAHLAPELKISMDSKTPTNVAMDVSPGGKFGFGAYTSTVPQAELAWYGAQSFIGYQMAAILAQQWLIAKCCAMPGRDAIRNGYEITVNDGTEVAENVLDAIKKADIRYDINKNMREFIEKGRVFGIRIAMFIVDSDDPDYYFNPFNIDGVTAGSYKGISQIDPYWITPELDGEAAGDPGSRWFYEPTWWRVNGKRIHRTHLIIYKTQELPDILKPTYIYGGVPIPQRIFQRVYAAERTANEAPMLALTKRATIIKVDIAQALANEVSFEQRMAIWARYRDNYGVKVIGLDEEAEQFDTALSDLDAVIMTQYQIVAAAANVPATKLLGTTPKGFNSSGEYEEASYHEELKSIQLNDLTPLVERHHLLLMRSEIAPEFNIQPFSTTVTWKKLDEATAEETANLNKLKAEADAALLAAGAIDGNDVRQRLINDPESGYSGLDAEDAESGDLADDPIADPSYNPELEESVQNDPEDTDKNNAYTI